MVRIKNTPIVVDEFKFYSGVYIYLLTHFHADHIGGLSPSWNNGTIYCSHVTRALLLDRFNLDENLVVALDEDSVHLIPLDNNKKVFMQVTLIDANHCPGAYMFLLEGYFGTILHTGDFRFDPSMLEHPALKDKVIDHLYLDDTFCSPEYDFPTREEAGNEILEIIRQHPNHYIIIGVDTLGKEELLAAIAVTFQTLIVVPEDRLKAISIIREYVDLPNVFTHNEDGGRVTVGTKHSVSESRIRWENRKRPTIGILPSGWSTYNLTAATKNTVTKTNVNNSNSMGPLVNTSNVFPRSIGAVSPSSTTAEPITEANSEKPLVYRVPYSLHSSFPELERFVSTLRPRQLTSVTKKTQQLLEVFGKYLRKDGKEPEEVPLSVKLLMAGKTSSFYSKAKSARSKKNIKQVKVQTRKAPVIHTQQSQQQDFFDLTKHTLSQSGVTLSCDVLANLFDEDETGTDYDENNNSAQRNVRRPAPVPPSKQSTSTDCIDLTDDVSDVPSAPMSPPPPRPRKAITTPQQSRVQPSGMRSPISPLLSAPSQDVLDILGGMQHDDMDEDEETHEQVSERRNDDEEERGHDEPDESEQKRTNETENGGDNENDEEEEDLISNTEIEQLKAERLKRPQPQITTAPTPPRPITPIQVPTRFEEHDDSSFFHLSQADLFRSPNKHKRKTFASSQSSQRLNASLATTTPNNVTVEKQLEKAVIPLSLDSEDVEMSDNQPQQPRHSSTTPARERSPTPSAHGIISRRENIKVICIDSEPDDDAAATSHEPSRSSNINAITLSSNDNSDGSSQYHIWKQQRGLNQRQQNSNASKTNTSNESHDGLPSLSNDTNNENIILKPNETSMTTTMTTTTTALQRDHNASQLSEEDQQQQIPTPPPTAPTTTKKNSSPTKRKISLLEFRKEVLSAGSKQTSTTTTPIMATTTTTTMDTPVQTLASPTITTTSITALAPPQTLATPLQRHNNNNGASGDGAEEDIRKRLVFTPAATTTAAPMTPSTPSHQQPGQQQPPSEPCTPPVHSQPQPPFFAAFGSGGTIMPPPSVYSRLDVFHEDDDFLQSNIFVEEPSIADAHSQLSSLMCFIPTPTPKKIPSSSHPAHIGAAATTPHKMRLTKQKQQQQESTTAGATKKRRNSIDVAALHKSRQSLQQHRGGGGGGKKRRSMPSAGDVVILLDDDDDDTVSSTNTTRNSNNNSMGGNDGGGSGSDDDNDIIFVTPPPGPPPSSRKRSRTATESAAPAPPPPPNRKANNNNNNRSNNIATPVATRATSPVVGTRSV